MKLILLNQYYPPDTAPTGVMVQAMAGQLMDLGCEVTVLCANSNYGNSVSMENENSNTNGLSVVRLKAFSFGRKSSFSKVLDYASYYLGVALYLLFHRADAVIALTTPPYLSVLARFFTKLKGGVHGHWVMDLYPDVLFSHGLLKSQGTISSILQGLAKWGWGGKRCAGVLTIGEDMAAKVTSYISGDKVGNIPLWSTVKPETVSQQKIKDWRVKRGWRDTDLVCLYSGNMGRGHRFTEFLEASTRLSGQGVRFVFAGQGKKKSAILDFIMTYPSAPVEVLEYVTSEDLAVHLASADIHFASMDPKWDGTMIPSKLQGIFAIGRPVIFIGSNTNATGKWIAESGAGWVIPPNDISALDGVLRSAKDESLRNKMGEKALLFSKTNFDMETNSKLVAKFFKNKLDSGNG